MNGRRKAMGQNLKILVLASLFPLNFWGCKTTGNESTVKNPCRRFLVVPPFSDQQRMSDYVANRWISDGKNHLQGCDRIIPFDYGKKAFSIINIDHSTVFDFKKLSSKKLPVAAERMGATDFIFIDYQLDGGRLTIDYLVYGAKNLKRDKSPYFRPLELKLSASELSRVKPSGVLSLLANVIPNALTLGGHSTSLPNRYEEIGEQGGLRELSVREKSILPRVVSGIGLTNLSHPAGFGLFDYELRTFGSLGFFLIDNEYRYERVDAGGRVFGEPIDYSLRFFYVAPLLNGGISLYWPLGTTFLSIGFGPGVYSLRDSFGDKGVYLVLANSIQLGHRVFLSERVFFQFAIDTLGTTGKPFVDNETFKSSNTTAFFFGLGYFAPEVRSLVRDNI